MGFHPIPPPRSATRTTKGHGPNYPCANALLDT